MKSKAGLAGLLLLCVALVGCETTGLSLRERGENNYANLIYGLSIDETSIQKVTHLKEPFRLAVVQVGEQAPHPVMIQTIKDSHLPVMDLIPLPAVGLGEIVPDKTEDAEKIVQKKMAKMISLARAQGADYMFLFGGSADIGQNTSLAQILDLTIIGGYIIPSNTLTADGKGVGALIDVNTSNIVFMVSADKSATGRFASYNYGSRDEILNKFRKELIAVLGTEFVEKTKLYF